MNITSVIMGAHEGIEKFIKVVRFIDRFNLTENWGRIRKSFGNPAVVGEIKFAREEWLYVKIPSSGAGILNCNCTLSFFEFPPYSTLNASLKF
jgi:hypothetical protein